MENDLNLMPDEKIISRTKHSWLALLGSIIVAAIIIMVICVAYRIILELFENQLSDLDGSHEFLKIFEILRTIAIIITSIISAIFIIIAIIKLKCQYLILTNKKLYGRTGVISKNILEIPIEKVDTIRVKTPLWGRIFKYSTLEIVSPASSKIVNGNTENEQFPYIKNINEFRKTVIEAIEAIKSK